MERGFSRRSAIAATIGVALALLGLAGPAHAVTSAQIVSVINAERQANGLPPVREDPALSAGCAAYDQYRSRNGSVQNAFTPGPEDPSKPGYTAAGARAARNSLTNAGDRPADSWANGDVFDDAPSHLFQLMNPALTAIGADQVDVDLGSFFGTAYISCVDTRSAPHRAAPRRLRMYSYLGPMGQVPSTAPSYREGPTGVGSVVFLYFRAPKGKLTLRSLQLLHADGTSTNPPLTLLEGGLRDGRGRARASGRTTGGTRIFFDLERGIVTYVGEPRPGDKVKSIVQFKYQDGVFVEQHFTVPVNPTNP